MVQVSAQTQDGTGAVTFDYEFGENLEHAKQIFGEDVVWSHALRSLTIASQSHARIQMKSGKTHDEILDAMSKWKPGAPRVARSNEDKVRELLDKMSPEEKARLAKELRVAKAA